MNYNRGLFRQHRRPIATPATPMRVIVSHHRTGARARRPADVPTWTASAGRPEPSGEPSAFVSTGKFPARHPGARRRHGLRRPFDWCHRPHRPRKSVQQHHPPPAPLARAAAPVFVAHSIGATGPTVAEMVFNTAITGYQEILTDPSYCQQIVTFTYPHIGTGGVKEEDVESDQIHAAGLVIKNLPPLASNFRATATLAQYLVRGQTVAIANVDTRQLTRLLTRLWRGRGAQTGAIIGLAAGQQVTPARIDEAIALARAAPDMAGRDLARVVSTATRYPWAQAGWRLGSGHGQLAQARFHVVAYDFGVKKTLLRMLAERGCRLTVVPAQTPPDHVLPLRPDGVFLSNGPGDPAPCDYAIAATQQLIASGLPMFGVSLSHQIMALASGARTFNLDHGHHGANHPVQDLDAGRVSIPSQIPGFAVASDSLPACLRATHISLFDGTLQGLERTDRPAFCFQGHPEASPGPHDIAYLFDRFTALMENA